MLDAMLLNAWTHCAVSGGPSTVTRTPYSPWAATEMPWAELALNTVALLVYPGLLASLLWRSLFQQEAIKRGILTHGNHVLSLAHTPEVIDATLAAYGEIFPILADAIAHGDVARRLEGPPIQPILRQ